MSSNVMQCEALVAGWLYLVLHLHILSKHMQVEYFNTCKLQSNKKSTYK